MQCLQVNTMRHVRQIHLRSITKKSSNHQVPRKKPSSELIQTLPDFYEPYSDMKAAAAIGQRRSMNRGSGCCRYSTSSYVKRTNFIVTGNMRLFSTTCRSISSMTSVSQLQLPNKPNEDHGYSKLLRDILDKKRELRELIPQNVSKQDMEYLSSLQSKSMIRSELRFLARKEHLKQKDKDKKMLKKTLMILQKTKSECDQLVTPPTIISKYGHSRWTTLHKHSIMARAMLFGQPLVIDMSYDPLMSRREVRSLIHQMDHGLHMNAHSKDPFHVHWTNILPGGPSHDAFLHNYGDYYGKLLVTSTEKSPNDVFPSGELVYLSPDSPHTMEHFDNDIVYVIGGFADRTVKTKSSLQKAESCGIRHAKLPLDDYLEWKGGCANRNLTIDQVMGILSELKDGRGWETALQHVPSRKLEP